MPIYSCTYVEDNLDAETRARVAEAITEAHCRLTGAPRIFAHVHFHALPADRLYSGGEPGGFAAITGSIRAGRPAEVKARLLEELNALWVRETGLPEERLLVALIEVDASQAMEAGVVLPHPGDEPRWVDALAARGIYV